MNDFPDILLEDTLKELKEAFLKDSSDKFQE